MTEGAPHFADYLEWGFVDPKGKIIDSIDYEDDDMDLHDQLAKKLKMKDSKDAIAKGYIRWHLSLSKTAEFVARVGPDVFKHMLKVYDRYMDNARLFVVDLYDGRGKRVFSEENPELRAIVKNFKNRKILDKAA